MNVWARIIDFGQRNRVLGRGQRVARMRVLEFYDRADVAGAERGDGLAVLAVEQIDLANFFGAASGRIIEFAPKLDRA